MSVSPSQTLAVRRFPGAGMITTGTQLALRVAVAAALSVALARLCRFDRPIYALIAAVIVTDLSWSKTSRLGLQRLAATVLGAGCGAVLSSLLQASWWAIGLSILIAVSVCQVLRLKEGVKVAGYICGIVMLAHNTHPWSYALSRLVETALGIGAAWLVSFVPKLVHIDEAGCRDG